MGRSQRTIFKCKHCSREFKKQGNFENHMQCHKMPKAFACAQCELLFISASKLKDHISEHLKKEVLDCNECGGKFTDEASFNSHACKQVNKALFQCNECLRSFKYLCNLKNHQKIHSRQRKKDLHSCQSCPKMFATNEALKKHGLIHSDIELNYGTSLKDSGIRRKDSKIVKQSARKSMRAARTYWCPSCNCGFAEEEKYNMHLKRHQRTKSNEPDTEKTFKDSPLLSSKSAKKYISPTKCKIVKQEMHLKNSKEQNIKTEAMTEYRQEQPIFFNGNQITVGPAQPHHLGGMYNSFVHPVQQPSNGFVNIGNVPNMQLISIPPNQNVQQNNLESVPKFDISSETYMRWLLKFINKCGCQRHPFSQVLVKKIGTVNSDLFKALIAIESNQERKEDHIYLMKLYKSLANIMYNHVKYHLTGRKS